MSITKEKIEKRVEDAKKQLEMLREQFVATQAVIADCEYWLAEWDKPEPEKDKD